LHGLVRSAVEALGYELVGVEYLPQGRHSLLRVYIDQEAGITLEDCERVSRQVSAVLEVEDPIKGQYTLEISSPGLDRPLFELEHYQRFADNPVSLRLFESRDGRRKFKGWLRGVRDGGIVVEIDGEEQIFSPAEIEKAHLIPEW